MIKSFELKEKNSKQGKVFYSLTIRTTSPVQVPFNGFSIDFHSYTFEGITKEDLKSFRQLIDACLLR